MDASLKKMLKDYEISLKDNLFIKGNEPSYEDAVFFKSLLKAHYKPSQKEYPSVWAWYSLVILFEDEVISEWLKKSPQENKNEGKKEKKNKENKENKEKKQNKQNKEHKEHKEQKEYKEETHKLQEIPKNKRIVNNEPCICDEPDNLVEKPEYKERIKQDLNKHKDEKSNVFLEIKPENEEQNLDNLAKRIMKEIKRNGLKWSDKYEIKEVAFKVKKLIMGLNVGLDTSVQDIIDQLETWEEDIQSVDFALFSQC